MQVGNRLILSNGSHRATRCTPPGTPRVPVLIRNLARQEELKLLPPQVESHRDLYLIHPRPPLLCDYFDQELRLLVHVPRKARQVRVIVGLEVEFRPGM